MNSLMDLNNYGETLVEFTDDRASNVLFYPNVAVDQTDTSYEGSPHPAKAGLEIIEIINYQTAAIAYQIDVSDLPTATVSWSVIPSGCSVTNPSTGVYVISGIKSVADWNVVKGATINTPNDYQGVWTYTSTITYLGTETRSWTTTETIINLSSLQTPTTLSFRSGIVNANSGSTRIVDPGTIPGIVWTITATPSRLTSVTSMSATATGGTESFNNTTKVLTITGTIDQVNLRLAAMTVTVPAGQDMDFTITYVSSNNTNGETDSIVQSATSISADYLSLTRGVESYSTNTQTTITNGPTITDASYTSTGIYSLEIQGEPLAAVASMASGAPTSVTFDPITPTSDEYFGNRTALSRDGSTLAVTGITLSSSKGFVDLYDKVNGSWVRNTRLTGSFSGTFASYGNNICISDTGSHLAVSDSYNTEVGTEAGAVFIYVRSSGVWSLQTKLTAPVTPVANDAFGYSMAMNNDASVLAVGSYLDETTTDKEGSVFMYTRTGTAWTYKQKIVEPTPGANKRFGYTLSMSPDGTKMMITNLPMTSGGVRNAINVGYLYGYEFSTWGYLQQSVQIADQVNNDIFGYDSAWSADNQTLVTVTLTAANTVVIQTFNKVVSYQFDQTFIHTVGTGGEIPSIDITNNGKVMIVGMPSYGAGGTFKGRVAIYYKTSTWTEIGHVDGEADGDEFGAGVHLTYTGNDFSVGARTYGPGNTSGLQDGRAYYISGALNGNRVWDSVNNKLIITGEKSVVNALIDGFLMTPATGYASNFQLYYKVITPLGYTSTRNQYVNKV